MTHAPSAGQGSAPTSGEAEPRGPLTVLIRQRGQSNTPPPASTLTDGGRSPAAGPMSAEPGHRSPLVLSVEDSPVHLKILCRYLEQVLGCRVLQADGVEGAVSLLLQQRPDVVVTDLLMPDLDGLDLVAVLQSRPDWAPIPVLVHSAVSDASRIHNLAGLGIRDYILKPFDPTVAIPRLRKVFTDLGEVDVPPPAAPRPDTTGRIPIVLASTKEDVRQLVQEHAGALYQVISVESGPAAIAAVMEVHPWVIFLTPDLATWDISKTARSLRSLKTLAKVPVISLPGIDNGQEGVVDLVRRELRPAPFTLTRDSRLVTVTVEDNFAPSCASALDKALEDALGPDTEQVVFEIPSQGIGWHVTPLLRELARKARHGGAARNDG